MMSWLKMISFGSRTSGGGDPGPLRGGNLRRAVRRQAAVLLKPIFDRPFADEVFLAGGAFKPLLKPGYPVRDLDLWVHDRKARERLCARLVEEGAELIQDFKPYCLNLKTAMGALGRL